MGKSGRSHRECGRRTEESSDSMSPTSESENIDDIMDIYTDTDQLDPDTEHYEWVEEDEDDI